MGTESSAPHRATEQPPGLCLTQEVIQAVPLRWLSCRVQSEVVGLKMIVCHGCLLWCYREGRIHGNQDLDYLDLLDLLSIIS